MAHQSFYLKVGRMRIYSGNTPTPFYLEIPFRGTITAAVDRPSAEEFPILDRGRFTGDSHYVSGDDAALLGPVAVRFEFRLTYTNPNFQKLIDVIKSRSDASEGSGGAQATSFKTIGGNNWITSKGTTQIRNADPLGSALFSTPLFTDDERWCCNVEVLWEDPQNVQDKQFKWAEVYFPPNQQITESDQAVMIAMEGECYGRITQGTIFTVGTAS
mgnify:FL=1